MRPNIFKIRLRKRTLALVLSILMLFSSFYSAGAAQFAEDNGQILIFVNKLNVWTPAGSLSYSKNLEERHINLEAFFNSSNEPLKVKLVKDGGGAAHLDAAFLGGIAPNAAIGEKADLAKLQKKDFDLMELDKEGIILTFSAYEKNNILSITARIEGEIIGQIPFQFPLENTYQAISKDSSFYEYALNSSRGIISVDGNISEVDDKQPFMVETVVPGSGHPTGKVYTWVMNDDQNLYVTFDVTPDNTMDGDKDYTKVYVKIGDQVKMFKVSMAEKTWGLPGFIYTDRVAYQHKVYEVSIPFSELEVDVNSANQVLELAFATYGTLSAPDLTENIWVSNGYYTIWEGENLVGALDIDEKDFYEYLKSEPNMYLINSTNPLSSYGNVINQNLYILDETELYFGDLNLGTGVVKSFDDDDGDEIDDNYIVRIEGGTLTADKVEIADGLRIGPEATVRVTENITAGNEVSSHGSIIDVGGSIIASWIWFDSQYGMLNVTVNDSIQANEFNHYGGSVSVDGSITSEFIVIKDGTSEYNSTELTVGGNVIANNSEYNNGYVKIGQNNALARAGVENLETDNITANITGDIKADSLIEIYRGTVTVGGTLETLQGPQTIYIYGGTVSAGEINSATDIYIGDVNDEFGSNEDITVNVTHDITANDSIRIYGGTIYAGGVFCTRNFLIADEATLFNAINNGSAEPFNGDPDNGAHRLYRTTLSGLIINTSAEITITNPIYIGGSKTFTTTADSSGDIYVWLLEGVTSGTANYGEAGTRSAAGTTISRDETVLVFSAPTDPPDPPVHHTPSHSSTVYHTITATAAEGGSITPSGSVSVARGSNKTFTITPNEGYLIDDVLVDGQSVGAASKYTFENVTKGSTIEAKYIWDNPFADVLEDEWYYDAIVFGVQRGLFNGTSPTTFEPNTPITRAMFVTTLGRLDDINVADYPNNSFDDVAVGQWYSAYVEWAAQHDIVLGYGNGQFGPNDPISREQICAIVVRYCKYAGIELSQLVDAVNFADDDQISFWAGEYVRAAQSADLVRGVGDNLFEPLGKADRAQVAEILMRLILNVVEP